MLLIFNTYFKEVGKIMQNPMCLHLFSQKRQYRSSAKIGLTEILILFKIKYFKSYVVMSMMKGEI